jgi:hypothetical protein
MLRIGAVHTSPTDHSRNEWQACTRPLGVWCSIWIVRVFLGCFVAISAYRSKTRRLAEATEYVLTRPIQPDSSIDTFAFV